MNAREELLAHMKDRKVEYVKIVYGCSYRDDRKLIEGDMDSVIEKLDFDYDSGHGWQELYGFIWYKDGTWSQRGEYDGAEWWEHMERPSIDIDVFEL